MIVTDRRRTLPPALMALAAAILLVPIARCSRRPSVTARVGEEIRSLLERRPSPAPAAPPAFRSWLTPVFYANRGFRAAWLGEEGLAPQARFLVAAVSGAASDGLDPCDYDRDEADARVFQAERAGRDYQDLPLPFLAGLDVLLTDVFFRYASHLAEGKVDPETGLVDWDSARADDGLVGTLEEALAANDIRGALLALGPQHEYYFGLRAALEDTRDRLRLAGGGEAREGSSVARHRGGLSGESERLAARARTIALNMERWRWLPRFFGRRFILIDTAAFRLMLGENGRVPMAMEVVVGNANWPTPFLAAEITGFVLNPSWNCPSSIFYKEIINYIRADKNYLPSNKMVILQGWGREERELDPAAMDWPRVNDSTYPGLHLRQLPGPANILGRLLFEMPNKEDIFLHDTPYQDDFKQAERIFSHGCIRAEKPFDLAAYLIRDPRWTKESMLAAIEDLQEHRVNFREPIPIYVNYLTAWPGAPGAESAIEFRRDVYGLDAALAKALGEHPPWR